MSNASNSPKPPPLIKAAGLWAKSSVKGGQYLTGRLGGVKVLVLENRDRHSDDDPSHILYFTEAPDRRQDVGERPQERSGGAGATHPPPDAADAISGAPSEPPWASQRRPWASGPGARPSRAARLRYSGAGQRRPRRRAGVGEVMAFRATGLNAADGVQLNGPECVGINWSECNSYNSDCLKSVGNPNYPDALKAPSAIKDDY